MKANRYLAAGISVLALGLIATSASAHKLYYPHGMGHQPIDPDRPLAHLGPHAAPFVAPAKNKSGKWTDVTSALPFTKGPWAPMQLTDGSVIIEDFCTSPAQWYRLTPDSKGQYTDGTWSKIAPMPSGYSPLFFAQQILPDGQVIINGGQYNDCSADLMDMGAIYDPVKNSWTSVRPPGGWSTIGNAESIILPNGTYMLADCCGIGTGEQALGTISGTTVSWTPSDTWSCPDDGLCMEGEGFTPLPDGNVFLVDAWNVGSDYNDYRIYDTSANSWNLAGKTADFLGYEGVGPASLTPLGAKGGTIIQFTTTQSPGVNDVYSVAKKKWGSGPVMEVGSTIYECDGAPAATLPDGNILVQASPGPFVSPSHFWEFTVNKKGKATATQVNDTQTADETSSFEGNLLVLPTGQVLWDNSQAKPNEVAIYMPKSKAEKAWLPVVSSVSATLTVGSAGNPISGTNFNGFSLGGAYGNSAQAATNFPMMRITNNQSGDVCFARSYNFSTMGVWTKGTTSASFDIPASCETGASTLQVIVNGIASKGVSVTLES
ncbi:MAG TPA: hypothetical protein VHX61_10480 [Rhizomicrobium sp.]|jgi:hypothetical protein|nr:hypothetical protein [Rhizomicrobium sp.]